MFYLKVELHLQELASVSTKNFWPICSYAGGLASKTVDRRPSNYGQTLRPETFSWIWNSPRQYSKVVATRHFCRFDADSNDLAWCLRVATSAQFLSAACTRCQWLLSHLFSDVLWKQSPAVFFAFTWARCRWLSRASAADASLCTRLILRPCAQCMVFPVFSFLLGVATVAVVYLCNAQSGSCTPQCTSPRFPTTTAVPSYWGHTIADGAGSNGGQRGCTPPLCRCGAWWNRAFFLSLPALSFVLYDACAAIFFVHFMVISQPRYPYPLQDHAAPPSFFVHFTDISQPRYPYTRPHMQLIHTRASDKYLLREKKLFTLSVQVVLYNVGTNEENWHLSMVPLVHASVA